MSQGSDPQTRPARKVFIKTYGCQMNVYDSQRMGDALDAEGYQPTERVEDADLVLLNTCHIREKAAEKIYSELGRIRVMKAEREAAGLGTVRVGITGCVAQAEGAEIIARAPVVDLVIGPQTYHRLPDALRRVETGERVVDTDYAVDSKFDHLPKSSDRQIRARGVSAFLTVQEGCDKFCTFCVVPYTRGSEVSRPRAAILKEARELAAAGVREVTLLGQNVNAWGPDEGGLASLLHDLAAIPGLARLRYTTSHPLDMDEALIQAHGSLRQLMPYLHLPVQSGSDRILKAMNRRHTAAEYLAILERIRAVRGDIALSGDFIVGFPGESDADFEDTLALVREVGYAAAYTFKYSPRPGTPGATMDGHVPEDVKTERLDRLQALIREQQIAFQESFVGRRCEVLIEKPGRHPGQMIGRSPFLLPVVVPAPAGTVGDIVEVLVSETRPNSLMAAGAEPPAAPATAHPAASPPELARKIA